MKEKSCYFTMSDTGYRPTTFDEFIGNSIAKRRVRIAVEAAQQEGRVPPHILLHGSAGCGKTTLANIVARSLNAHIHTLTGGMLTDELDLFALLYDLYKLQEKGEQIVLVIDEIHGLASTNGLPQEAWFPLLEDFKFYHSQRGKEFTHRGHWHEGWHGSMTSQIAGHTHVVVNDLLPLQPFTCIGMTTDPALLKTPLRDRFGLRVRLHEYTEAELAQILHLHAEKRQISIMPEVEQAIAQRARGNPRWAIQLLCECRDRAVVDGEPLSVAVVGRQADLIGIQADGIMEDDLKVLRALAKADKGLSLASLAAITGISTTTLSEMVEPFLKLESYLVITNRRKISAAGKARLEQEYARRAD